MTMLNSLKKRLYFVVATYFAFWAKIVLRRWRPRIVVVTGSSGKTTLLHLIEAQVGNKAEYSHHANSAIGLSLYVLGLEPNIENRYEWFIRAVQAPFLAWRRPPRPKLFIAEADTDRPNEGKFIASLLKPEVTLWVSVYNTHSMNFDYLISSGKYPNHRSAIAYDFGYFLAKTQKMVALNADQAEIVGQLKRIPKDVEIKKIHLEAVKNYKIVDKETTYEIDNQIIHVPGLHPKELAINLQLTNALLDYLGEPLDAKYRRLLMPPGRTNVLKGKRGITIIDSTYNTGLGAMSVILRLFDQYPGKEKWLVLGDILEQGSIEQDQHQKLANVIAGLKVDHVVLLGPRTKAYTYPKLEAKLRVPVVSFEGPKEVLEYLEANLKGGEAILFKGGRFLEGVIEQLLADPRQASQLVRREKIWVKRRQKWGLPR